MRLLLKVLAISTLLVTYSFIVLRYFDLNNNGRDNSESGELLISLELLSLSLAAFSEEIFFRLGIQNFIAYFFNWKESMYFLAILITSILWAFGHASPEFGWVKIIQILPLGLALGFLYQKEGIEACIFTHLIFNISILYLVSENLI